MISITVARGKTEKRQESSCYYGHNPVAFRRIGAFCSLNGQKLFLYTVLLLEEFEGNLVGGI